MTERTMEASELIDFDGRKYRKFIPFPGPVRDGTVRCITCGQIDEPKLHDDALCPALQHQGAERG